VEIPDEYIKASAFRDIFTTAEMTSQLLELPDPPTCILFPDDFASLGGINAIKSKGLKIPRDISIAGYDGIKTTKYLEPQLTTISQDTDKIGRYAGLKLIELIEKPKTALAEYINVPGELDKGATVSVIHPIDALR